MPIEIRELVIRTVAVPESDGEEEIISSERQNQASDRLNVDAIIQECVRRVLSILRQKEDR